MNLPPEKKAELMAKYGGAPADKPKPPPMEEDEEMDPEERYVDSGDVLGEDDEEEDIGDEGSGEMAMEPPPSEGASVNDETFNRRRGEEERARKMPPIDKLAMREAARKAVGNG